MTLVRRKKGHKAALHPVKEVNVGDMDPMSREAHRYGVATCGTKRCTRIAGHREAEPGHPARRHVIAPAPEFVAVAVWP